MSLKQPYSYAAHKSKFVSYTIRTINIDTDIGNMTNLISQNLNTGDELAARSINWSYMCNPLMNAEGLALLDESTDCNMIGMINLSYRHFLFKNKQIVACVFGDLVVESKHRSLMPALMLLREAIKVALDKTSLVYSFPNKKSVNVALRAGFEKLGKMTRYVYVVSHRDYLDRIIKWKPLADILAFTLDNYKSLLGLIFKYTIYNGYHISNKSLTSDELQFLVANSVLSKYLTAHRSCEFITWRYHKNPFNSFISLKCLDNSSSAVCGYAILEKSDKLLHIRDIYAIDEKSFSAMLYFCVKISRSMSIPAVSLGYFGNERIKDLILDSGFIARESDRSVVIKYRDADNSIDYFNTNNWYLVDGDEDH